MNSDRERFEALYRGYYDQILCFVARRSDPQTARDVTADTFLAAWRRIDTLHSSKEQAWLYVTARKLLANAYRGKDRRVRLDQRLQSQPRSDADDPADRVTDKLFARQLFEMLPPQDREVSVSRRPATPRPAQQCRLMCGLAALRCHAVPDDLNPSSTR